MTEPPRAVYDCMIFLQAAVRPDRVHGTIRLVEDGAVTLHVSRAVATEVQDVLTRPKLRTKFPALTPERVGRFLDALFSRARFVADVPAAFPLPRDPKGEPYLDLAVAARRCHLVTWNDRHLTYLMRRDTPDGVEFGARFPDVRIVNPPEFVQHVRRSSGTVGDQA